MPVISTWGSLSARAFGFGAAATGPVRALWAWGDNTGGQLGLGNTTAYSSPKQVGALTTWASIAANVATSAQMAVLAVKTDGTLWAWGNNATYGQLGLGNKTSYSSPKQVGALTNWASVAEGSRISAAIKTDGTLWTWGNGYRGGLGLGNQTDYSSPKQVGALTNWSKVSAGQNFMTAVKTDGTLWSWGDGRYGRLGLNNTLNYSSPKQVGALTTWSKTSSNNASTLAVKTDGTMWGWGSGAGYVLAQGNNYNYSSPKQIGALTTWADVALSQNHAHAVKTDGTLWGWGTGQSGNVGKGNTTSYVSPIQIGALTNWLTPLRNGMQSDGNGSNAAGAIKTDGSLWVWGNNNKGQLGLGNLTNYSSPKQVGAATTWKSAVTGSSMLAIKG